MTKTENPYEFEYKKDYQEDWDVHRDYIQSFDAYEAMLLGQVYDSVSRSVDGSKITDSYSMTLAKERADRVMAKLPEGQTEGSKSDAGKAAYMDILRQKWVYPNANAQHPFFEKLNMWQLYSSVYGYMPMFYDWNVSRTGYVGPDCWLWNPRNLIPQQGRTSIADMDYVTALTWVGQKYLEDIDEDEDAGWDSSALKMLLGIVKNERTSADADKDTLVERTRVSKNVKKGICLATRYEAGDDGEWITFAPDHGCIEVRRLKNPHKNGRIPFVVKYSQPLFDSFYGLGDFQRAKPLQFARDGLTNFYFKGIKMNLIPPIIANAHGVVKHTVDYREGAVMFETIPNSIRRLETSTAGLATYQAAQSALTGSLLSLYGTQNASIPGSEALNPSQGKTPAAIREYTGKEATRDGAERRHLEAAIEELTDGFFSLVVNIGTEDVPINLFSQEIQDIVDAGMEDLLQMFTGDANGGTLKIKPSALKGVEYRFHINPDSTEKISHEEQIMQLERLMDRLGKFQNIFKDDPNISVNWGQIMETYESLLDIKGVAQFVTVKDGPSAEEQALMEENQQLQEQGQQMQKALQESQQETQQIQQQVQQMSDMLQSVQEPPAQPQVSDMTVPGGGDNMFTNPELGAVAEQIQSM